MASDRTRTPDEEQARLDNHVAYSCLMPCGCSCGSCQRLIRAHAEDK